MAKVEWSSEALDCLKRIHAHIAADHPFNAARVAIRLIAAAGSLAHAPMMGKVVARYAEEGLREVISRPYRIVYVIRTASVRILAIGDCRRDLPPRLRDW